jgi:hypothetical protein
MNSISKQLLRQFISEEELKNTVGVFGGGFQPPTKGHLQVVKQALEQYPLLDKFIIFVGTGGGRSNITQQQSVDIWNVYKKLLPNKVEIVPSSNPISSIYSYTKENPETNIIWFLGSREGKEEDFIDFMKRTKAADKPNLKVVNIITKNSISGTLARKALDNKDLFFTFLPSELSLEDKEQIYNILTSGNITEWIPEVEEVEEVEEYTEEVLDSVEESNNFFEPLDNTQTDSDTQSEPTRVDYYKDHIQNVVPSDFKVEKYNNKIVVTPTPKTKTLEHDPEFKKLLISLTLHMVENGLNIEPLPDIVFVEYDKKNANNMLGRTAHYDPNTSCITLYTYDRHPKDILRSYAHEMIHHMQNLEGRIQGIKGHNINEDEYLKELEEEAYSKGNMCFRGWENSLKENINEWVIDIPKYNQPKTFIDNLRESLHEIVLSKENAVDVEGSLTDGQFIVGDQKYIYKIKILQLIESKYNIEIKDEEVENIITFDDLLNLIINKK